MQISPSPRFGSILVSQVHPNTNSEEVGLAHFEVTDAHAIKYQDIISHPKLSVPEVLFTYQEDNIPQTARLGYKKVSNPDHLQKLADLIREAPLVRFVKFKFLDAIQKLAKDKKWQVDTELDL